MLRLALILAAAAAFVLLLRSPLFDISVIEVEGNQLMSDGEIIEMTGVKEGDNLFSISSRKVKAKLKKMRISLRQESTGRFRILML